jgi:hypothetical protein
MIVGSVWYYANMLEDLFHLPENKSEPLPIRKWFYELIWCPSQCYYHVQHNGIDYILYLRWRWENPWQAHVVKNAAILDEIHKDDAIWSENIFGLNHVQFRDDQIELAEEKIISLSYEFNGDFPQRVLPKQRA